MTAGRASGASAYPPWPAAEVVEQRMYEGFPSRADERRMAAFHGASGTERVKLVETLEDDRLRELGRRLVFYENPEGIPEKNSLNRSYSSDLC